MDNMNDLNKSETDNSNNKDQNNPDDSGILSDGIFSMKISEEMGIRNILRSGLVEAQGKNAEKIPMFVSWPNWLDDGIVCLFARDFHSILADTIRNTVVTINKELEDSDFGEDDEIFPSETAFEPLSEANGFTENTITPKNFSETIDTDGDNIKSQSAGSVIQSTSSKIIKSGKYKT
jgi:hypothetical protein